MKNPRKSPELFLDAIRLGKNSEQWISECLRLPYLDVMGILFGNDGGGITEPKLFRN